MTFDFHAFGETSLSDNGRRVGATVSGVSAAMVCRSTVTAARFKAAVSLSVVSYAKTSVLTAALSSGVVMSATAACRSKKTSALLSTAAADLSSSARARASAIVTLTAQVALVQTLHAKSTVRMASLKTVGNSALAATVHVVATAPAATLATEIVLHGSMPVRCSIVPPVLRTAIESGDPTQPWELIVPQRHDDWTDVVVRPNLN